MRPNVSDRDVSERIRTQQPVRSCCDLGRALLFALASACMLSVGMLCVGALSARAFDRIDRTERADRGGRAARATATNRDTGSGSLRFNGNTRSYLLYRPAGPTMSTRLPLVIALHGGGSNGAQMRRYSGLDETAQRHGFLVAYPDGSGRAGRFLTWNAGDCCAYAQAQDIDDVGFVLALIDELVAHEGADPSRVYLTGISNGAMMSYRVAATHPERIAAIAPVAGSMAATFTPRGPVPVMHTHGTEDPFVPFAGGVGPRARQIGPRRAVRDVLADWAGINGATLDGAPIELPDTADDGTHVIEHRYRAGRDPRNVVLYEIVGGGHTWPNRDRMQGLLGKSTRDFELNEAMWAFFAAHRK